MVCLQCSPEEPMNPPAVCVYQSSSFLQQKQLLLNPTPLDPNAPEFRPASDASSTGMPVGHLVLVPAAEEIHDGNSSPSPPPAPAESSEEQDEQVVSTIFLYPSHLFNSVGRNARLLSPSMVAREHSSRALLLMGVSADAPSERIQAELEQWGPVRRLGTDRKHEGLVIAHFFDVRHASQALQDIQAQHLVQQHKYQLLWRQQQLAEAEMAATSACGSGQGTGVVLGLSAVWLEGLKNEQETVRAALQGVEVKVNEDGGRGLIVGKAVWAQFTPVSTAFASQQQQQQQSDMINQGTLVVFNLDVELQLDVIKNIFQAYGDVKEVRETPIKKQHKFVEFYDVRNAATALKALDGTEIGGNRIKIEFSRPGGTRKPLKQLNIPAATACNTTLPYAAPAPPAAAAQHYMMQPLAWSQEYSGVPGSSPTVALPSYCLWGNYSGYQLYSPGNPAAFTPCAFPMFAPPYSYWNTAAAAVETGYSYGSCLPLPYGCDDQHYIMPLASYSCAAATHQQLVKRGSFGRFQSLAAVEKGDMKKNGSGMALVRINNPVKHCKGRITADCYDERHRFPVYNPMAYRFNEQNDSRTTLMIRNIPNKYSQQMLIETLDEHCWNCNQQVTDPDEMSAYDFLYLPIDFRNKCNLGYAFVNFTSVQATVKFYKAFQSFQWEAFNSRKICEVSYARIQGLKALESHFKSSRYLCEPPEHLPVAFNPPRTGNKSTSTAEA